jgi:hypothetical protein
MILSGSDVAVSEDGEGIPVDFLVPSREIFSPLSASMKKIKHIECVVIDLHKDHNPRDMPVLISATTLSEHCPASDLYVSPDQLVTYPLRLARSQRFVLEKAPARDIGKPVHPVDWKGDHEIKYFKLIMEHPCLIEVNGTIVMSY